MQWWTEESGLQLQLLVLAFVLCALIGFERQFKQKAAGFRTHVLVGTGSATFTLVSAYGFESIIGPETTHDPSRIAAQIVTGIGFIGAGVIFTRRNVVRGLTTAATIWVAAGVGMAAGAGMPSLAIGMTFLHLFAINVLGPLVLRLPTRDTKKLIRIVYNEEEGTLRRLLEEATILGFSAYILSTNRFKNSELAEVTVRFKGRSPLHLLVPKLHEIEGVTTIEMINDDDYDDEHTAQ